MAVFLKPSSGAVLPRLQWPLRRWLVAVVAGLLTALLVGVPTAVVPNEWFTRMTPVLWWNYPVLAVTAILAGLTIATYVRKPLSASGGVTGGGGVSSGGLLSAFAVGCPVCNKLVVLALGTTGALNIWAPMQPLIAVAAMFLLAYVLRRRLRAERICPALPPRPEPES